MVAKANINKTKHTQSKNNTHALRAKGYNMRLQSTNNGIKMGTNILDIEVPKYLEEKVQCGLDYADDIIGGEGYTPSAVTLFTGSPGAGKTTMLLCMADGFTKNGCNVLFNTAEESLYQTAMVTKRLGLRHGFHAGSSHQMSEILAEAKKMRQAEPTKQLVLIVDSLQCIEDNDGSTSSRGQINALQDFTDFCKEHQAIGIMINQVGKSGNFTGSNKLKHMVDSHIHLSIEEKDEDFKGCRILECRKNRFGGSSSAVILKLGKYGFRTIAKMDF